MTYTVRYNQCLADIAIEVYGDVRGIFWLLADNPPLTGMADRVRPGQPLSLRPEQLNPRYVRYLADFAPFASVDATDFAEGIGAWWLDEYVVSQPGPVNLATMASVTVSTRNAAFVNPQSVALDPLPPTWSWGPYGWNDNTPNQGEDVLSLIWPVPVTFTSVEVLGLTADARYTYDPTVTSPYALTTYDLIDMSSSTGHFIASVHNNTFAYVKTSFDAVTTTRLDIRVLDSVDHLWTRIVQMRVINIQ